MENNEEIKKNVREDVYNFFADLCNVEVKTLNDKTDIVADIGGDSLMFLQLLEKWKFTYNLDLEFRLVGKYLLKHPVITIGDTISLAYLIIFERETFLKQAK